MTIVATSHAAKTEPSGSASPCEADHCIAPTAKALRAIKEALASLPLARQVKVLTVLLADVAGDLDEPNSPNVLSVVERDQVALPSSSAPLTARQRKVYDWIVAYIARNTVPPTIREIGAAMGYSSTNATNDHLTAIERKGFITRVNSSRGIRIVQRAP
jgi:hypothetical protein